MKTKHSHTAKIRGILALTLALFSFQPTISQAAPDTIPGLQNLQAAPEPEKENASAIVACQECATACERCATGSLQGPQASKMAKCIAACRDCSDLCSLAARHMARDSASADKLCALCAEVCLHCAGECEKHDDAHCKQCADACRKCAAECRKMAK